MEPFTIKRGAQVPIMRYELPSVVQRQGLPAPTFMLYAYPGGPLVIEKPATIVAGEGEPVIVEVAWDEPDTALYGEYYGEFHFDLTAGRMIIPSKGYIMVRVT